MAAASRLGDLSSGHEGFFSTAITTTPVVKTFVNGIKAASVGATLPPHNRGKTVHSSRVVISGSSKVFIEGNPAVRIGDSINCGDTVGQGSNDTQFGG
jgi:uncharacterized Zn-binding protein involved in type VI secretion